MQTPEIISIGNMLVEIMRQELDEPFYGPGSFVGPFPSGDTPIYIDTAARLGHPAGFIGVVGQDDFGKCLLDRFARDGVDASWVQVLPDYTTGVAFVAYFSGGTRKFIYHWRQAAAGQLAPEHVHAEYIRGARWLHVTGCNLAVNESCRAACYKAVGCLAPGSHLSFDANVRPELLTVEQIHALCQPVIERADILLPSLGEAAMLTGLENDQAGCRMWAAQGKTVVLKQGARGCRVFRGDEEFEVAGFNVEEVDPTGAGDSFGAAFSVAVLEGMPLRAAARFANAAGALAVTKKGPMEGAPARAEVEKLLSA